MTITTHEAKTHLSRYLAAVERGEEFIIAKGSRPIAKLAPINAPARAPRPKVGQMLDTPMEIPDAAFAPLSETELESWGL